MNIFEETIRINQARAYIMEKLPKAELLAQLAEEGAELTHAALKLRRVVDGTNPTPKTLPEAVDALMEEVVDVLLLISLLGLDRDEENIQNAVEYKTLRWADRLKGKEKATTDQATLARMEVMPKRSLFPTV